MKIGVVAPAVLVCCLALAGCGRPALAPPQQPPNVPGLGEIMSLQQMRHTKLWLAGSAENWKLAAYEVDELAEGFDDIVKFHPTIEGSPVQPKDAIPHMVIQPLERVRAAVEQRDEAAFAAAYDVLTAACNNCHQATNHGFNVLQRPAINPYPDQRFAPPPTP